MHSHTRCTYHPYDYMLDLALIIGCAWGHEGLYVGRDVPFNPLRIKGALGMGGKKRKADLENDNDGAILEAMQELLEPRVPQLSPRDVPEYSFLGGGEGEKASDLGDDSDEASI
ncbi:hypothetical protein HAX54_021807 [Datura stramonium]|uniref:Uncharacterized protein n=1 Tax=Datura stramonium TaxID=4076 RepID=A0ABS8UUU1_DATST|nr:hypothetical protein [Datura stramonium]